MRPHSSVSMSGTSRNVFVILIGLVFTAVGIFLLSKGIHLQLNGIETSGNIIGIETARSQKGKITYAPKIEFISQDGTPHTFTSYYGKTMPQIGKKVIMLYDPNNPDQAVERNYLSMFFFPAICLIVGVCLVLFSVFLPQQKEQQIAPQGPPKQL